MNIKRMLYLIETDIKRYAHENGLQLSFFKKISILLTPCVFCVVLYRISSYFFSNRHFVFSRFFWSTNMFLFSADIVMSSQIGESFYMPHPVGVAFMAKVGNNATFYAQVGIAARKRKDIGAGIGMSILGDDVVLGAFSKVVGPVRIGNNVKVAPATVVFNNVPDNVTVYGVPARIIKHRVDTGSQSCKYSVDP